MSVSSTEEPIALPTSDEQWKKVLTAEQYKITRCKGTEAPFSGEYWNCKKKGAYCCVCCGAPLFSSEAKYESGSGWPSFTEPYGAWGVDLVDDFSHDLERVEVVCKRCNAHLGHVFEDGPEPTGLRYCINSAALQLNALEPQPAEAGHPDPKAD